MGHGPNWTQDEIAYLEDRWGNASIKRIATHLNRSVSAVKQKAHRMGLDDASLHYDGITLNQLAEATNISYSILKNWVKLYGFPAKKKLFVEQNRVYVVKYDDFWKWAEANKQMINFSKIEKYSLGPEPDWVDEKRKADLSEARRIKKSHNYAWSKDEDRELEHLLNAYRYTYPEIAKRLHRSEGAVKRRIRDLGLKARPIRLENHIKYTIEDIALMKDMYDKGYCLEDIAERINKSALGVRGKFERMGYRFKNGVPVVEEPATGS